MNYSVLPVMLITTRLPGVFVLLFWKGTVLDLGTITLRSDLLLTGHVNVLENEIVEFDENLSAIWWYNMQYVLLSLFDKRDLKMAANGKRNATVFIFKRTDNNLLCRSLRKQAGPLLLHKMYTGTTLAHQTNRLVHGTSLSSIYDSQQRRIATHRCEDGECEGEDVCLGEMIRVFLENLRGKIATVPLLNLGAHDRRHMTQVTCNNRSIPLTTRHRTMVSRNANVAHSRMAKIIL